MPQLAGRLHGFGDCIIRLDDKVILGKIIDIRQEIDYVTSMGRVSPRAQLPRYSIEVVQVDTALGGQSLTEPDLEALLEDAYGTPIP